MMDSERLQPSNESGRRSKERGKEEEKKRWMQRPTKIVWRSRSSRSDRKHWDHETPHGEPSLAVEGRWECWATGDVVCRYLKGKTKQSTKSGSTEKRP